MSINPNLILQLLISIASLWMQMRRNKIDLDGKTEDQLKALLTELDAEMMKWGK